MPWIGIAIAGFFGALARYWLGGMISRKAGGAFPWGTLAVNLTGALLLGILVGAQPLPERWAVVASAGFLGAFTTFSTLQLDSVRLMRAGHRLPGLGNLLLSGTLGLGAAALGLYLGRLI